jgi:hypothetical protein
MFTSRSSLSSPAVQRLPHCWQVPREDRAFPALSQSTIALLGSSHAAYLANKTVPRTLTT